MTCKDCKYFDTDNHPKIFNLMSRAGHCDKRVADGYDEYPHPDCDACNMFELSADYGCDEIIFPKKVVPVYLKIEKIIKHEFDFSDIEEIEDSTESVRK